MDVMHYQFALPQYRWLTIAGRVAYQDHVVDIPLETPATRVPSPDEWWWCDIADCPVGVEGGPVEENVTEDF